MTTNGRHELQKRPHDHHCALCDLAEFQGITYAAAHEAEHRCGVRGFDQMRGDVCPACEVNRQARERIAPPIERAAECGYCGREKPVARLANGKLLCIECFRRFLAALVTVEAHSPALSDAPENERQLFEQLSYALTGGNAATWEEVIHAATHLAALRAHPDLRAWVQHKEDCEIACAEQTDDGLRYWESGAWRDPACTCGLDAALAALSDAPERPVMDTKAVNIDQRVRQPKGFSYEKSQRIGEKAFALSAWFNAHGGKPDEWMDLFSEIIIADDQALTAEEIRIGKELAAKHGWLTTGDGNQPPSGLRVDPGAPRTVNASNATKHSSDLSGTLPSAAPQEEQ